MIAMVSQVDATDPKPKTHVNHGPRTPEREQEDQSRYSSESSSLSDLRRRFEEFSPARCESDVSAASAKSNEHTRTSSSSGLDISVSGDDGIDSCFASSIYDFNEPILQENTDRFCLLPVKYVWSSPPHKCGEWCMLIVLLTVFFTTCFYDVFAYFLKNKIV